MPRNRSEEHTSELQSLRHLVCRLLLEKKKNKYRSRSTPRVSRPRSQTAGSALARVALHTAHESRSLVRLQLHEHRVFVFFFFNDTATTEIYTLSLHDALPI